jgi:hypothetical protein
MRVKNSTTRVVRQVTGQQLDHRRRALAAPVAQRVGDEGAAAERDGADVARDRHTQGLAQVGH